MSRSFPRTFVPALLIPTGLLLLFAGWLAPLLHEDGSGSTVVGLAALLIGLWGLRGGGPRSRSGEPRRLPSHDARDPTSGPPRA